MFKFIQKHLQKEVSLIQNAMEKKDTYSVDEVRQFMKQMQNNMTQSIITYNKQYDDKLSQIKNQLKHKNKLLNQTKLTYTNEKSTWNSERLSMKQQMSKDKKKIQQLLRQIQRKHDIPINQKAKRKYTQSEVQCDIMEERYGEIRNIKQKQNIFLKQQVNRLEEIVKEKQEDLEAATILIKELVSQLQTNTKDRETEGQSSQFLTDSDRDVESQNSSQNENMSNNSQLSSQLDQIMMNQPLLPQSQTDISTCDNLNNNDQDCSTIDGSSTSHKDFALPQWLQFDDEVVFVVKQEQNEDEELKMWPQLLWNRCRQVLGMSYQV